TPGPGAAGTRAGRQERRAALPSRTPAGRAAREVSSRWSVLDRDGRDDDVLLRAVARAGRRRVDRVDDRPGRVVRDLAEDRVLAVEPRRRHRRDEELGPVGALGLARDR